MSFGAEIHNSGSDLLITEAYLNFKFRTSGTIAPAGGGGTLGTVTHPSVTTPPLISASPQDRKLGYYTPSSGSPFTGALLGQETGGSINIPYAIQDLIGETPSGNWGMQVFNASGLTVYDSRIRYMDIVDIKTPATTLTGVVTSTQNITHASLPNAYYVLNSLGGFMAYSVYVGTPAPYYVYVCVRGVRQTSATNAQLGWCPIAAIPSATSVSALHAPTPVLLVNKIV